jgi:hypothetical protein
MKILLILANSFGLLPIAILGALSIPQHHPENPQLWFFSALGIIAAVVGSNIAFLLESIKR